jgi:endonuclease YncB( thermonuclease family)
MILLAMLTAVVVPAGATFTCTPVRVWDGDGPIWCAEGPHVRLAGIAAREIDGSCQANQPCPRADPIHARDALVSLVGRAVGTSLEGHVVVQGSAMRCLSDGGAGGNRTAAWCVSPVGGDLSCAMVMAGWALRWPRYWGRHQCAR